MKPRGYKQFSEKLGKRLAAHRSANLITQEQLAEKTGLSRNTIALIESGERGTTTRTLYKLVTAIGVKFDTLFKDM